MGGLIHSENWKVSGKGDVKNFDLSNLSAGMYVAKVSSTQGTAVNKITIER